MESGAAAAGVDVGGTFTDVVVHAPGRRPRAVKVPTTPGNQAVGVEEGSRVAAEGLPLALLAHGTTTATNAVLERAVARTVLVTTRGFADVLEIGRQQRPALYDLDVTRPVPVVGRDLVVTVHERIGPDGRVIVPLDDDEIDRVVQAVGALAPEAVAVSLLFSYAADSHERRVAAALEALGVPVTRSSALLPEVREYERASTVALNAAVAPVMQGYLANLVDRMTGVPVTVMTSGGGTAGPRFVAEAPVHTLLSGPAAGVVAAGAVAGSAGFDDAVAFDMGGTSTDVCLIRGGVPQVATSSSIDGLPFRTPAVDIHTVGAGGGSIAWVDRGGALRVGPRSAGAHPGPACYGLGGTEPTVTDAHCALGHLSPDRTLGGGLVLDRARAQEAIARLPARAGGADGILTVVRATMVRALRRVTTERGIDPADLALVAYGGAGPLHATALARELGCRAVVVPPAPGVLSALGLLLAPPRQEASRTVMRPADARDLAATWEDLARRATAQLRDQGADGPVDVTRVADVRYAGQSHELRLDVAVAPGSSPGVPDVAAIFHRAHEDAYGYAMPEEPVVVVTQRAVATAPPVLTAPPVDWAHGDEVAASATGQTRRIGIPTAEATPSRVDAQVVSRASLAAGDEISGPALIEQGDTTTLLLPQDRAHVDRSGNLVVHLHA